MRVILAEAKPRSAPSTRPAPDRGAALSRLLHGTRDFACAVLSLSAGGAQIRLDQPIGIWSTVTLVIDGIGALHCRVVWQRSDVIALQFVQNAQWVNGKILAAAAE